MNMLSFMSNSRIAQNLIAFLLLAVTAGPFLLDELASKSSADSPIAICEYEKELGEEKQSEVDFGLCSIVPLILDLEPSVPVEIQGDLENEDDYSLLHLSRGPPVSSC